MEKSVSGKRTVENIDIVPASDFPAFALLRGGYTPVSDSNPRLAVIHYHNLIELGCCVEGSGELYVDGKTYRYKAGDVTFIPAKSQHYIKADEDGEHFWEYFYFDADAILGQLFSQNDSERERLRVDGSRLPNIFTAADDAEIVGNVTDILEEMRMKRSDYRMMVRILTSKLLLALTRRTKKTPDEADADGKSKLSVMPAINYIHEHFCENLYIEDLAVMCYMSPASFRRKFREATGHTALETINNYRIIKACDYLAHTDMSVKEISTAVGFDSVSGFCRRFSDVMGITPLKWKNSSKKGKRN